MADVGDSECVSELCHEESGIARPVCR